MAVASATETSDLISSYNATQAANAAKASTASTDKNALIGNYDTFLKILTAQLKNQDPTQPMDASEFTNQLVMYSQVEQQIATNDKLEDMLTALNSNGITPFLNYIGQYTESKTTDELVVQNGTGLLAYDLPSKAQSVTLSVQDSEGNVIATVDAPTTAGMNRIAWDGGLDAGGTAEDGVYKFVLTAKNSNGDAIEVDDIRVIGQVTSIETDSEGNVALKVGELSVDDTDVLSVFAGIGTKDSDSTTTS